MFTEKQYQDAAKMLSVTPAHLKAFAEVESDGDGFLSTGEPKILFERHIFYRQLGANRGKEYADYVRKLEPDICNTSPTPPGSYGKYSEQHPKLQRAVRYDRPSALESASWGAFQIMGYHWRTLGYTGIQAFINDAYTEAGQLELLVRFLKANPSILIAMRARDWAEVARQYNGPSYAKNQYDVKLAAAYKKFGGV